MDGVDGERDGAGGAARASSLNLFQFESSLWALCGAYTQASSVESHTSHHTHLLVTEIYTNIHGVETKF